jgi:hypothetical protein
VGESEMGCTEVIALKKKKGVSYESLNPSIYAMLLVALIQDIKLPFLE